MHPKAEPHCILSCEVHMLVHVAMHNELLMELKVHTKQSGTDIRSHNTSSCCAKFI